MNFLFAADKEVDSCQAAQNIGEKEPQNRQRPAQKKAHNGTKLQISPTGPAAARNQNLQAKKQESKQRAAEIINKDIETRKTGGAAISLEAEQSNERLGGYAPNEIGRKLVWKKGGEEKWHKQ